MLKNYKELNVWKKLYKRGERKVSGIKRGNRGCRENAESDDQIPGKQTLGSLNPFSQLIGRRSVMRSFDV